jgi:hypothetical protein
VRHRQRAEECLPLAQPAKRISEILLDIATQWSTLAAQDAETRSALLVAIKKMDGRGQSPSQSE